MIAGNERERFALAATFTLDHGAPARCLGISSLAISAMT